MSDVIQEFQKDFRELMAKYEVGLYGTMYFRIGEEELVLDTTEGKGLPADERVQAEVEGEPDSNEDE